MFKRVLVANRGEIAVRIIRTLTKMGIEPVVVYSTADQDFSYVKNAKFKVCLGPGASSQSYLCENALLEAASQMDCEAIHPGYGFLSENAIFAKRCEQQKLTFIGPSPNVMSSMGDKNQARVTMNRAGVKILPGSSLVDNIEEAKSKAEMLGYPVLLKAKSGGGGKGMRLVEAPNDMDKVFHEAKKEAAASFGDSDLYVEKFIKNARHIEFQVLCDKFGQTHILGTRDCSIQRKNQKIIEEALAGNISEKVLSNAQKDIQRALSHLGYFSAGTLEFLLDQEENLYFMEMNTRIQVEHTVTEMLYGIDLIEEQINIAANQKLSVKNIKPQGHAIECRITAESPEENFKPQTGVIKKWLVPKNAINGPVRIDTHIEEGSKISPYYDSMIAKLITHGKNREEAIKLMMQSLKELEIAGIKTNVAFLQKIISHQQFLSGTYHCGFLSSF